MLYFRKEIRKEIAYGIVESWTIRDGGKTLLEIYNQHGRCPHITTAILTQESHDALEKCVDKTFLALQNNLYEDIADALDDWLDVYKIKNEGLRYGS